MNPVTRNLLLALIAINMVSLGVGLYHLSVTYHSLPHLARGIASCTR